MTDYPDVSHYQRGLSLAGAPLVFAKATQGAGYIDPEYGAFKAQAAHLGCPFGAYHWLDTTDAAGQAEHCFRTVGPGVPLMIDDEQPRISVPHTLAFTARYRQLGGLVRLEYLPRWAWSSSGSPDLRPLAAAGLALVASDYRPADAATGAAGWKPYGGVSPTVLQYTSTQLFNGQRVDFNRYLGPTPALLTLINGDAMIDLSQLLPSAFTPDNQHRTVGDSWSDAWRFAWFGASPFGGEIRAQLAAIRAAQTGESAAITALTTLLNQALAGTGTGIDVAQIFAHIDQAVTGVKADMLAALHHAAQAEADALGG